MHITVAICTYNRAQLLDQTLTRMHALRIPDGVTWELLVVNNNCTDQTSDTVARHASRLPLRMLMEPKPGLSNARNHAVDAAAGELILWTDDDVLVSEEWLAEYVAAATRHADADYFGGTVEPWFPITPPRWVLRNIGPLAEPYALAQHGLEVRAVDSRPIVGANMAFRTVVLRRFPFDATLGKVRDGVIGGEETDLFARMRAAGHHGVWVGPAIVKHYIQPERLSSAYLWRWYAGLGAGMARRDGVAECTRLFGAPRWALKRYGIALARYSLRSIRRDATWIPSLRHAALMRGYVEEARRLAGPQSSPSPLREPARSRDSQ